ncbi:MAG: TauD/TfdA family dioxygenase [Pseudomonadota bacterium]
MTRATAMRADGSTVALNPSGLTVEIDGVPFYFNAWWLRSACSSAIDPITRERVLDLSTFSESPKIASARVVGETLLIEWQSEPLVTRLSLNELAQIGTHGGKADPAALPRRLWYADAYDSFVRVSQSELDQSDAARARLARALIVDGVAIVTGMENSEAGLARLVSCLGPVTPSAEGETFEVRVEIEPTNLAFTSKSLEMHTDLPGEEWAPGIQFLHCRANTVDGGMSLFADGAAVAAALRAENPDFFRLLTDHAIPFFYRHDLMDYRAHQRVIELDARVDVSGVTVSQHLMDDIDLPQDLLDSYFPALHRFLQLLNDPRFVCRFRLNPGECITFDNHRIVHGREAYSADSGERHLRGCYTDRGALRSTYRVLARQGCLDENNTPPIRGKNVRGHVAEEMQTLSNS